MSVDSSSSCSSSSSENGKGKAEWWHAWLHIFVSVVGAPAIATLPLAFAYLGFWIGLIVWAYVTWASYYSGRLLIQLQGPNQATYARLADGVMGTGFAACWIRPFQFMVLYQVTIITALTIGSGIFSLQKLSGHVPMPLPVCTTVGGLVIILTSLLPSIADMWRLSFLGGLTAVGFTITVLVACSAVILRGEGEHLGQDFRTVTLGHPTDGPDWIFGVLNSFGILAFSYGGHSVLPDVQATLQESMAGHGDAQKGMQKALIWAYVLIIPCYLATAVLAYLAFGFHLTGFLPDNLQQEAHTPDSVIAALNVMLIVNTIALGAIYIQAGFNLVEDMIACWADRSYLFRFFTLRLPWVASATFIAVALPFFGDLAGLSGAIGFTPMTFVFPFLIWERSEFATRASWWRHLLHAILGISFCAMGVVAFAGALYLVIRDSANYHFFT